VGEAGTRKPPIEAKRARASTHVQRGAPNKPDLPRPRPVRESPARTSPHRVVTSANHEQACVASEDPVLQAGQTGACRAPTQWAARARRMRRGSGRPPPATPSRRHGWRGGRGHRAARGPIVMAGDSAAGSRSARAHRGAAARRLATRVVHAQGAARRRMHAADAASPPCSGRCTQKAPRLRGGAAPAVSAWVRRLRRRPVMTRARHTRRGSSCGAREQRAAPKLSGCTSVWRV